MKSFLSDAITRAGVQGGDLGPSYTEYSSADQELVKILESLKTNIKIIGCGGGGTNTIDRLSEVGIVGADIYAANTDAQHLLAVRSPHKVLLGRRSTRGLGAGALPQIGQEAAMEAEEDLRKILNGSDIVFVTAGMGGGTGTGAAPYVAKLAKDMGALTIAVVTYPFKAEGAIRAENAEWGLERMRSVADTVRFCLPNINPDARRIELHAIPARQRDAGGHESGNPRDVPTCRAPHRQGPGRLHNRPQHG